MTKTLDDSALLFQYRKCNKFLYQSIKNNTLYFSSLSSFNDQFEASFNIGSINHNDEGEDFFYNNIFPITALHDKKTEEAKKIINSRRNASRNGLSLMFDLKNSLYSYLSDFFGIACFSKSYSEILMWAHYADAGKGVCLVFKDDLFRIASNGYPKILPVIYEDKIPNISVHLTKEKCDYDIIPSITIKKNKWKYEKEHRAIVNFSHITEDINKSRQYLKLHSEIRNIPFKPDKFVGVIFGPQCSNRNINKIKKEILEINLIHKQTIKLYQCKLDKFIGQYSFSELNT